MRMPGVIFGLQIIVLFDPIDCPSPLPKSGMIEAGLSEDDLPNRHCLVGAGGP